MKFMAKASWNQMSTSMFLTKQILEYSSVLLQTGGIKCINNNVSCSWLYTMPWFDMKGIVMLASH